MKALCKKWRAGEITATAAMKELGLKPNTFYRRVKEMGQSQQTALRPAKLHIKMQYDDFPFHALFQSLFS